MSMTGKLSDLSPEALAELKQAIERAGSAVRDPEIMRRAADRMDRMREELRSRVGELEVAVDLTRETRDHE